MTLVTPAIMIGGTGTRLWPLSRTDKPKQFHKLGGDQSLLQQTLQRFAGPTYGNPWLLTGERGAGIGEAHAAEIGIDLDGIVIEPTVRSTAPALAASRQLAISARPHANSCHRAGACAPCLTTVMPMLQEYRARVRDIRTMAAYRGLSS